MSDLTSRVSLYKPAGGENVNVTTDLNNNLDKIDTNLNFRVVANATARNAISPYWAGLNVRQTNDGTCWVSNGTAPISASWDQIATANTYITNLNVATPATGSSGFVLRTQGEGADRIRMRGDGQLIFGDGTNAPDTNIYRASANTLRTDDSFQVGGSLQAGGDLVTTNGQLALNLGGSTKKNAQPSSSVTVASSTTETIIATYSIPANDMVAGAVYKITAWGTAGVTGTPTLTYRARMGGVAGTTLGTCAVTAAGTVANKVWRMEIYVVCLTTGGSGTAFGNLSLFSGLNATTANPATNPTHIMDGGSAITVNTTTSQDLVITSQWSASSASNTITSRGFAAERIA